VTTAYELWETRTGNLMDSFGSREEALLAVAEVIRRYGPSYVDSVVLISAYGDESKEIATGADLAEIACPPRAVL